MSMRTGDLHDCVIGLYRILHFFLFLMLIRAIVINNNKNKNKKKTKELLVAVVKWWTVASNNVDWRKDKSLRSLGNLAIKRFTNKRIIFVVYRVIRGQKCCQRCRWYYTAALRYDFIFQWWKQYFMYARSEWIKVCF